MTAPPGVMRFVSVVQRFVLEHPDEGTVIPFTNGSDERVAISDEFVRLAQRELREAGIQVNIDKKPDDETAMFLTPVAWDTPEAQD